MMLATEAKRESLLSLKSIQANAKSIAESKLGIAAEAIEKAVVAGKCRTVIYTVPYNNFDPHVQVALIALLKEYGYQAESDRLYGQYCTVITW